MSRCSKRWGVSTWTRSRAWDAPCASPPGRIIFQHGEPGDGLYIIASGLVRVYVGGDGGAEATIAMLSEGESLGELALIGRWTAFSDR